MVENTKITNAHRRAITRYKYHDRHGCLPISWETFYALEIVALSGMSQNCSLIERWFVVGRARKTPYDATMLMKYLS